MTPEESVQLAWARSAAPSSSPPHCDHRGVQPDRRALLGFASPKVATFTRLPLLGARAERAGRRSARPALRMTCTPPGAAEVRTT
jgi:hypothetical protein